MVITRSQQKERNASSTLIELKKQQAKEATKVDGNEVIGEGAMVVTRSQQKERNAYSTLIELKKQLGKEATKVAGGNEVMGEGSGMGGVGATNLAKGGGAYATTNDEASGDKTKVIERNASSTLIEQKKQPAKTLPEVAGGKEVMGEGTSMGGVGDKTLAKSAGAYENTNDEGNSDNTETLSPMAEGVDNVIERNASSTLTEH